MTFPAFLRRRVIAAPARIAGSLLGSLAAPLFPDAPALAQDQPGPSLSLDLDVIAARAATGTNLDSDLPYEIVVIGVYP